MYDIYNITGMIELFEITYSYRNIGMMIAFSLCMVGNDFVPKCEQYSHGIMLKTILEILLYRDHLFRYEDTHGKRMDPAKKTGYSTAQIQEMAATKISYRQTV